MSLRRNKSSKKPYFAAACILCGIAIYLSTPLLTKLHEFLSLTKPVDAHVIIVEGWLFDYMLDAAAEEIKAGSYSLVITTGKQRQNSSDRRPRSSKDSADYCKERLIARGIESEKIIPLPAPDFESQSTYHTALATRDWLLRHNVEAVNVYTGGPHGRKTYLIYGKVMGDAIRVGVISCKIKHYDPVKWWTSLRGIRVTTRYTIGYLYALIWNF